VLVGAGLLVMQDAGRVKEEAAEEDVGDEWDRELRQYKDFYGDFLKHGLPIPQELVRPSPPMSDLRDPSLTRVTDPYPSHSPHSFFSSSRPPPDRSGAGRVQVRLRLRGPPAGPLLETPRGPARLRPVAPGSVRLCLCLCLWCPLRSFCLVASVSAAAPGCGGVCICICVCVSGGWWWCCVCIYMCKSSD
jgi:hypothetical protein